MELIKDYNIGVNYHLGKANVIADTLSRKVYCNNLMIQEAQPELHNEFRKLNLNVSLIDNEDMLEINITLEDQVREAKKITRESKRFDQRSSWERHLTIRRMKMKIFCFRDRLLVPKQKELKDSFKKEARESTYSIHLGSTKMYHDLQDSFWWSNMKREVAEYVSHCDVCRRFKVDHRKPA
jgi:hypothetical protein